MILFPVVFLVAIEIEGKADEGIKEAPIANYRADKGG
jgi:hypothetical protein